DPTFPGGVKVVDDTALDVSFALDLETVPTLLRVDGGEIVARTEGWMRSDWEAFTGRAPLGAGLPEYRPGCGSRTLDPNVAPARPPPPPPPPAPPPPAPPACTHAASTWAPTRTTSRPRSSGAGATGSRSCRRLPSASPAC